VPLSLGGGSDRIGQTVLQTVAQENYFKIMSAFVDVLTEISLLNFFSKLSQRLIACHEYFPTCSK